MSLRELAAREAGLAVDERSEMDRMIGHVRDGRRLELRRVTLWLEDRAAEMDLHSARVVMRLVRRLRANEHWEIGEHRREEEG